MVPGGERAALSGTSPEFACKKLPPRASANLEFARSSATGARAAAPSEFTLVEWYRVDAPYELLMDDCAAILALAATTAGSTALLARPHR